MDTNGDGIINPLELGGQNWENRRLTSLSLQNQSGVIPESIWSLTTLKSLDLGSLDGFKL